MRILPIIALLFLLTSVQSQTVSWSNPQVVLPGAAYPSFVPGDDETVGPLIKTTSLANGALLVVWSDYATGKTELYASFKIGNVFTPPTNLSQSPNQESLLPDVISTPSGKTCVAWSEFDPSFGSAQLYLRVLNADGTWAAKVKISNASNAFNFYPSMAFTSNPDVLLLVYTELKTDGAGNTSGYTIRFKEFNIATKQTSAFASPELSPLGFNFRATLLNQGADKIHCCWYDPEESEEDYDSYIAYSLLESGTWSATEKLSTSTTISTWDDGPIKMLVDQANNLFVIWTAFAPFPSNAYIIKKPENGPFQAPVEFHDDEVLNWAFAISKDGTLNAAGTYFGDLLCYQFDGSAMNFEEIISNGLTGISKMPEMINIADTLHLFWVQGETLMYSYMPPATSSTGQQPNDLMDVTISPNPCRDILSVNYSNDGQPCYLNITDQGGNTVISKTIYGQSTIDMGKLIPGTYFLSISTNGVSRVQKFVKLSE